MKLQSLFAGVTRVLLLAALPTAASAVAACSSETHQDTGAVQIIGSVSSKLSSSDVTLLSVHASGPSGQSRDIDLTPASFGGHGQWTGTLSNLEPGLWTFYANAYACAPAPGCGAPAYTVNGVTDTILAGNTGSIVLHLQESSPAAPFTDDAPIIESLSVSTLTVAPGGCTGLTPTLLDYQGDLLTFAWSSGGAGTFTNASGTIATSYPSGSETTTWCADPAATPYDQTLTFIATDPKGLQAAIDVVVHVTTSGTVGDENLTADVNTWPIVHGISSSNAYPLTTSVSGHGQTNLYADTSDDDGDSLTYAWTSSCNAIFSDPTIQNPTLFLTADYTGSPPSQCFVQVTVDDGHGGSNFGYIYLALGHNPAPGNP